ncbi:MAG: glycosyltransferase family 2 protein [Planctomycetes bacterium]|nr:glycosyltransferase family 2 protein [Planctomycetota bacterium]
MSEWIFWLCAAGLFYTYVGYPCLLALWSAAVKRRVDKGPCEPSVSIVVAAHNEAKVIRRRIENLLALDYPKEKREILVVSDGSTDGMDAIVSEYESLGVKLVRQPKVGKAAALNLGVCRAKGAILLFADARQVFDPEALRELVANFNDPTVGAVSGELIFDNEDAGAVTRSIGAYWRYEKWMRKMESRIDSMLGATGAIYAIRRELYEPVPRETLLDDVLIPMRIVLRGKRAVFEPEAVAYDKVTDSPKTELKRKVRTLAGNYQLLCLLPALLSPIRNRVFVQFASHKAARLAGPFLLILMLLSNMTILHGGYVVSAASQTILYALAVAGSFEGARTKARLLTAVPHTFLMMNYAAFLGFIFFVTGRRSLWARA